MNLPAPDSESTTTDRPTVSVVMPTHERLPYLREAIAGALAQTFTDFEIVVSDSTPGDAIASIVAEFDDPRIRYHRNPTSTGPLTNFQNACRLARASLVASLHDDDRWDPNFLARMVPPLLEHESVAMVFCDYHIIDEHGIRQSSSTEFESTQSHRAELAPGLVGGSLADRLRVGVIWNAPQPAYAGVMRRDLFLAVDIPDLLYDIWATYSFVCAGHDLFYVDERLTEYRVHSRALTSTGFGAQEDRFFERVIADQADNPDLLAEVRARIGQLQWWRATEALERREDLVAQAEFAKASANLTGLKAGVAGAAARSAPVRTALRVAKIAVGKLRSSESFTREKAPAQLVPARDQATQ